jgi:2-hydroxychromene-2-carboxylate isomerase
MPWVSWALTHEYTRDARRGIAEGRRRLTGRPHVVDYFHQADDPYSHLAAQVLGRLRERYDVAVAPHLVGPPSDDAAPERERLDAFARKDAADVAPYHGLDFPAGAARPSDDALDLAQRLLTAAIADGSFERDAIRIGDALWRGGRPALDAVASTLPPAAPDATRAALAADDALRARLGHYLGATFHYGGEWYWGVDRLWHLERRLQSLGVLRARQPADPIVPRPAPERAGAVAGECRLRLEFFASLRSPYTAIVFRRVLALPTRLPVDVVVRPVLPMVMRGLPVPTAKRLYIVLDTKREADDAGEPFGFACDPVGRPVERAFSLHPWACSQGRGAELLAAFTRAAFAEGVDTGEDDGLRHVVEQAGLSWAEARPHLDREGWRDALEENRRALLDAGLWGVPCFRLVGTGGAPDFCTWGQDRLWLVEAEIRRRLASLAA